MPPQTAKSLMKEFRASFRRKKVVLDQTPKTTVAKEADDEELAKLAEMKENLGDHIPPFYDDADLLSFLRARQLNVKEAEKLLKLDENVKRFMRMNEYRLPMDKQQYNFSSVIGVDKNGSLVRLINIGHADAKGLVNMVSTIEGLKILMCMINHDMVLQEKENMKSGKKCKQLVYLINLEDLSMSQISYKPAFDTVMQILKLLQDLYHDALKEIYFVNAPPFFSSVFKLFKPVIQESLQQKIKIFEHDSANGELLRRIDADILPQFLGGNRVDSNGDPRCTEFVHFGAVVPTSCYASNFLDPEDPDVVNATIPAGATLNFRFPSRQIGSLLKWHIQAKDNDIAMGLYREPFSARSTTETPRASFRRSSRKDQEDLSALEQLTPVIRSQCHISPEEGSTVLWFTGNVVLHFDNTYSWMNSKEVFFKISVTPPTQTERNFLNSVDNVARGISYMSLVDAQQEQQQ